MSITIAPSMLSADFGKLREEVEMVNSSNAGLFHLDIMDGVFVPNISYGFPIIKSISDYAKKPMDAHLMIVNPDKYLEKFQELGVLYLSVHYEACTHLHRTVQKIKSLGMKSGVAINPHTPISLLTEILEELDFVLIMSVNPGFGGQSFIPRSIEKIIQLKSMILSRNLACQIEVDGGITEANAPLLLKAGADILVAGNSVFKSEDPINAIERLSLCESSL